MENVVRLAAYRRRRKRGAVAPAPADAGPRYFCTRCDADEFRIAEAGTVHCAQCGALMRNLLVNRRT
jgi:DNA-directed RNA polymerase subunit RPC12/RpoP